MPKKVCSYCKGRETSVAHTTLKDCPRYQAYKVRKAKGLPTGRGRRSARRRGTGTPQGFESTLARLRAKRDAIDAAIRMLEAVEGLLR